MGAVMENNTSEIREYRLGKGISGVGIGFIIVGLMFFGMGAVWGIIALDDSDMFLSLLSLFLLAVGICVIIPAYQHYKEAKNFKQNQAPVITLTAKDITFHTWIFGPLGTYQFENIEMIRTRFGKRLAITRAGGANYGAEIGFLKNSLLKRAKILKGRTTMIQRGTIIPGPMELKDDIIELWGKNIKSNPKADAWEIVSGILDGLPTD